MGDGVNISDHKRKRRDIGKLLDKKGKHKYSCSEYDSFFVSKIIFIGELPNDSFMFHSFAEELPKMLSWDYI